MISQSSAQKDSISKRLVADGEVEAPRRNNPKTSVSYTKREKPKYLAILTTKNLLLMIKNPKNVLFLILTPFLLSLFLWGFQKLALQNASKSYINPPVVPTIEFPHCTGKDCVSLVYMNLMM